MTDYSASHDLFQTRIRGESNRLMALGVALLIIGAAAIFLPVVATLVATLFVGAVLFFSGLAGVFGSFTIRGTGPFFGALLLGLLSVAAGIFFMARPVVGAAVLTAAIGVLFMIQGASEAFFAFELRPNRAWGWMLGSALLSILLAIIIIAGWPNTALVSVGIIMGVNFLTSGAAYIGVALTERRTAKALT